MTCLSVSRHAVLWIGPSTSAKPGRFWRYVQIHHKFPRFLTTCRPSQHSLHRLCTMTIILRPFTVIPITFTAKWQYPLALSKEKHFRLIVQRCYTQIVSQKNLRYSKYSISISILSSLYWMDTICTSLVSITITKFLIIVNIYTDQRCAYIGTIIFWGSVPKMVPLNP